MLSVRICLMTALLAAALPAFSAPPRACFDPDAVRGFQPLGPDRVRVDTGRREYVVTLANACPQMDRADHIAFSRSPFAARHLSPRAWQDPAMAGVAVVEPVDRVCGRGEWLVPAGFQVTMPQSGCRIVEVSPAD